jgi:hypothetical protein
MLQNPEIKKKEKYHLRPRFATAGSSVRSALASGGGILTWAGIVPALTGDSVCTRIIRFVGASGELEGMLVQVSQTATEGRQR